MIDSIPNYSLGDRVRDGHWGVVGTVTKVFEVAGIPVVEVEWDRSTFRIDDPDISPFDEEAEARRIDAAVAAARAKVAP